jgi:hypothetical protein
VVEAADRLHLEVSPEDARWLLNSRVLELTKEDIMETGEQGVLEEEIMAETVPALSFTIQRFGGV